MTVANSVLFSVLGLLRAFIQVQWFDILLYEFLIGNSSQLGAVLSSWSPRGIRLELPRDRLEDYQLVAPLGALNVMDAYTG